MSVAQNEKIRQVTEDVYKRQLFSHTCLPGPTFDAYEPSVALRAEPQKKSAGLFRPAQPIFRT